MTNRPCTTGKVRFPTREAAQGRLKTILETTPVSDLGYQPTGVLRCPQCGGFHLTSESGKPRKTGKRRPDRRCR